MDFGFLVPLHEGDGVLTEKSGSQVRLRIAYVPRLHLFASTVISNQKADIPVAVPR